MTPKTPTRRHSSCSPAKLRPSAGPARSPTGSSVSHDAPRLEARKRRARVREQGMPEDVPAPPQASTELRDVLDEEIGRLAERFRLPVVLCYLDGYTNAEAAQLLGCPEGTVASRLSTAREKLHARLTRRGLAPLAGGLAVALTHTRLEAMPPLAATASSTSLAQGVIPAMFIAKLKSVVIAASCVAFLGIAGVARLQVTAHPSLLRPEPRATRRRINKRCLCLEDPPFLRPTPGRRGEESTSGAGAWRTLRSSGHTPGLLDRRKRRPPKGIGWIKRSSEEAMGRRSRGIRDTQGEGYLRSERAS